MDKPQKGMLYVHRRFMDANRAPLLCKVTRIAQGVAYYRPAYGKHDDGSEWLGSPYYVALEKFWQSFHEPMTAKYALDAYAKAVTGIDEQARDKLCEAMK